MMELYKREKVNPAAGCLPILIQMPFFFAFYWMLVESVEMRQAPFALWIDDLSARDPFFVLPALMAAAMFFQTRMSPAPPDPVQARMMQIMPLVFAALLDLFPGGPRALSADEHDAVDLAAVAHQHDRRARVGHDVARIKGRRARLALRRTTRSQRSPRHPASGPSPSSGCRARGRATIARALTGRDAQPRLAELADVPRRERSNASIAASCCSFRRQRSFTGEDVVELHCHGGRIVSDALLAAAYRLGARPAEAGEFTLRAFLNDKIDLLQAEAIADLVASGSAQAARAAVRSLDGEFSAAVTSLQQALTSLRVRHRSVARLSRRGAAVRCGARVRRGARRAASRDSTRSRRARARAARCATGSASRSRARRTRASRAC